MPEQAQKPETFLVAGSSVASFVGAVTIREAGIVPAKRVELAVGTDDMSTAAVNAVLVPRPGVHERLDEEPERVRFVHLKLFQQFAQRFGFTAAFHQVLQTISHFVAQKILHLREVDEIADGIGALVRLEEVTNGRAIRIAAWQRREILEA